MHDKAINFLGVPKGQYGLDRRSYSVCPLTRQIAPWSVVER